MYGKYLIYHLNFAAAKVKFSDEHNVREKAFSDSGLKGTVHHGEEIKTVGA